MKNRLFRVLALAMLLALAVGAVPAMAAAKPKLIPELKWAGDQFYRVLDFKNMPDDAKITKVTSSKPKVLAVEKWGDGLYDTILIPHKAGKAKITVKYKIGKKSGSISATYTVKKYPKPVKAVSFNGKKVNIKTTRGKYFYEVQKYKKTEAKVSVTPSKGWRTRSIDAYAFNDKDDYKDLKVKNGKAFKLAKGYSCWVTYHLVNAAGEEIEYTFLISRS